MRAGGLTDPGGDLLFAGNDEEARWRGWSIEARHAGLTRVYRDPAFDRLVQCPDCRGAGRHHGRIAVRAVLRHRTADSRSAADRPRRVAVMAGGRSRRPNDPSVLASLEKALSSATRPNPVVAGWRWRYELALMLTLAAVTFAIVQALGAVWLRRHRHGRRGHWRCGQAGRRLLIRRAWCVITPHRLRTGCAHSWIQSRYGRLPVILFTTARPFGERVLLWCVAGISAEDLRGAKDALVAACWAADMRITASEQHAHLVIVDVIRRVRPSRPGQSRKRRLTWPG